VLRLLLELNQELGVTMAIVTHNEKLAAAMDRTLRLSSGKLTDVTSESRKGIRTL
jgi:predicted ABC-type transport system involved in lysophospholipase L1 biosynthesis ATPase subunit